MLPMFCCICEDPGAAKESDSSTSIASETMPTVLLPEFVLVEATPLGVAFADVLRPYGDASFRTRGFWTEGGRAEDCGELGLLDCVLGLVGGRPEAFPVFFGICAPFSQAVPRAALAVTRCVGSTFITDSRNCKWSGAMLPPYLCCNVCLSAGPGAFSLPKSGFESSKHLAFCCAVRGPRHL